MKVVEGEGSVGGWWAGWGGAGRCDGQPRSPAEAELSLKNGAWPSSKGQGPEPRHHTVLIMRQGQQLTWLAFQTGRPALLSSSLLSLMSRCGRHSGPGRPRKDHTSIMQTSRQVWLLGVGAGCTQQVSCDTHTQSHRHKHTHTQIHTHTRSPDML